MEALETPMRLEQRLLHEVGGVVLAAQIARQITPRDRHQVRLERLEKNSERLGIRAWRGGRRRFRRPMMREPVPAASPCPTTASFSIGERRITRTPTMSRGRTVIASNTEGKSSEKFVRSPMKMRKE